MPITATLPHRNVDNPPRRYTRSQNRAGGRISGETRRLRSHPWHRLARRLYRNGKGCNYSQIARALGRHASTVSRLLRGIIKTLLDAAEIAAGVNPYPAATDTPLRELCYTQKVLVSSPAKVTQKPAATRRKRRWNWCRRDCEKEHRHWYSQLEWDDGKRQDFGSLPDGHPCKCDCGFVRESASQICPMCGRHGQLSFWPPRLTPEILIWTNLVDQGYLPFTSELGKQMELRCSGDLPLRKGGGLANCLMYGGSAGI